MPVLLVINEKIIEGVGILTFISELRRWKGRRLLKSKGRGPGVTKVSEALIFLKLYALDMPCLLNRYVTKEEQSYSAKICLTSQHLSNMWANGRKDIITSELVGRWSPNWSITALTDATTFSWVSITPLGFPVVPLV